MRRLFTLLTPFVLVVAACGGSTGSPSTTPTTVSIAARPFETAYDFTQSYATGSVPLLGRDLLGYQGLPTYDASGAPLPNDGPQVLFSDGTEANTVSLLAGNLSYNGLSEPNGVELDGVGYFLASPTDPSSPNPVVSLYSTDGTAAGTRSVDRLANGVLRAPAELWLLAIGSGKTATLCVVGGTYADDRTSDLIQVDCYRPNEGMRKRTLGTINASLDDGIAAYRAGDSFYLTLGRSISIDESDKNTATKLFSVTATADTASLKLKSSDISGRVSAMLPLGDNASILLVTEVVTSATAPRGARFDVRRIAADGTVSMLISAPAAEFGGEYASFAALLSADGVTTYLTSYTNESVDSTSWLYALVEGTTPRVLGSALVSESFYEMYRSPTGRIGVITSAAQATFSWIGDAGLEPAVTAPEGFFFIAPILLADGSAYLSTYTTTGESGTHDTSWYYLPVAGAPVSFKSPVTFEGDRLDIRPLVFGESVYVVESQEAAVDSSSGEVVLTRHASSWLYRLTDGVATLLTIDQPLGAGERRDPLSVSTHGGHLFAEALIRDTVSDDRLRAEQFELLP